MSRNNSKYKSTNKSILTTDDKELILCRNHNIPIGITHIGTGSFSGYANLQTIVIPDNVTKIADYAFSGCTSLQSIAIPDNVTEIGECAFSGCTNL